MRKYFLIIAIFGIALQGTLHDLYGQAEFRQSSYGVLTSPQPFSELDNQAVEKKSDAAVSTGYMYMDNMSGYNHPVYKWKAVPYNLTYPNIIYSQGGNGNLMSTEFESNLWHRIYPGYYSTPVSERERWDAVKDEIGLPLNERGEEVMPREGYRYFRNPAQRTAYTSDFTTEAIDSTTNSFAGPIPIGFAFYMNGLRYDSFYVSTCGIIALSNRRYYYNGEGVRSLPPNEADCYDPNSADWPFKMVTANDASVATENNTSGTSDLGRVHSARGSSESVDDPELDNWGFVHIASGGDLDVLTGGIRSWLTREPSTDDNPNSAFVNPPIKLRLKNPAHSGGAYITPFEGPFYMPQVHNGIPDDRGKVWYKRNAAGNNLIIYFENFHMMPDTYQQTGATDQPLEYEIVDGRVGQTEGIENVLEGSVQVELNGLDNSITFRYGDWQPVGSMYTIYGETKSGQILTATQQPWDFFQPFASVAVGGYARHKAYNSKTQSSTGPTVNVDNPWAGQYAQYTQYWAGYQGNSVDNDYWIPGLFSDNMSIKFQQWRNALRLVDVQYRMRDFNPNSQSYGRLLNTGAANNLEDPVELLAGHAQLGNLQPVVLVQSLTNDIQGPDGVNFVEQDFQFQSHVRIANKITGRIIYNRIAKVADTCLYDFNVDQHGFTSPEQKTAYCGAARVVWTKATTDNNGNYTSAPYLHEQYIGEATGFTEKHNGIAPYNFVEITFPTFAPNRNVEEQLGLMELTTFTDATHPITNANIGDEWTMDDTAHTSFWVIANVVDFRSNGEFHRHNIMGAIPDITKWVHSSLTLNMPSVIAVPGGIDDNVSHNPLPPLGVVNPINTTGLRTPVTNPMYRFYANNSSKWSKLTSFPIDLRNNTGAIVSLAVQKGQHDLPKNRGFSDDQMVGPEARVFYEIGNASRSTRYLHESGTQMGFGTITGFNPTQNNAQSFEPSMDFLFVEYLSPSPDNVSNIVSTGAAETGSNISDVTYEWDKNNSDGSGGSGISNRLWRGHTAFNANTRDFNNDISYLHTPALAVFGGGGYFVGWTFANNETYYPVNWNGGRTGGHDYGMASGIVTLDKYNMLGGEYGYNRTPAQLTERDTIVAGLMPNPYDVGFDDQFHRYSVVIPDYYIIQTTQPSDPGANFRFRIRAVDIAARTSKTGPKGAAKGEDGSIQDDADQFFVDNVAIVKPVSLPDIELQSVNIPWPYISAPITQATNLQVISRLTNMGSADATRPFNVKVRVYRGQLATPINVESAIYCNSVNVPNLAKGEVMEITTHNLNLGEFATNVYPGSSNMFTIQAIVNTNGIDQYTLNDTIYSHFVLTLDTVMKYVSSTTNDVPNEVGLNGKGLNLGGHSIGGYMQSTGEQTWVPTRNTTNLRLSETTAPHGGLYMNFWDGNLPRIGYVCGGNIDGLYPGRDHGFVSGQIAVKFEIKQADSLRGVMAQFGGANQSFDDISFNIYSDNNGLPGAEITTDVPLPLLARRLYSKASNGAETFVGPDAQVLYEFARPVSLPIGTYWVSIDQRGETGLELAASGESMGMRTMIVHARNDNTTHAPLGDQGMQLLVDKRLRVARDDADFGRVYENNNIFAYRNIMHANSAWNPFMPTFGQVAYPHLNHIGMLSPERKYYQTFTRGTWAPLVVPYFGNRTVAANNNTAICPDEPVGDDEEELAINITSFVGVGRQAGIELFWEAISTNDNNSHFIIERQDADEVNTWTEVEHVLGSVEKSTAKSHSLLDKDVTAGKTYRYRLYQMYADGSLTCQNSHTVTVAYNPEFAIDLAQNSPNPFNNQTNIDVTVPTEEYVTLEIIDIFGNVVKTLADNELLHGSKRYVWNGDSNTGVQVSNGHYMYRLTAGTETITKKLTLLRSN